MFKIVYGTIFKKGFTLLILCYLFLFNNLYFYSSSLQDSSLTPFKINSASDEDILNLAKENHLQVSSPQEAREKLLEKSLSALQSTTDDSLEVTIESQNSLSYFTASSPEQSQERLLEVKGDVSLSLKEKDGSLHQIRANHILWNEKRKTLYANNKVSYLLEKAGTDTFRIQGDGLYLDITEKNLVVKGVKGQTPWVQEGQSLTLSFSGNSLRGSLSSKEEIFVIENEGFLTTSHIFKPYYRIQANKIWVIGSGEWAVWNAVFYLGNVPIFYLPYYFYSNKILSFNPQFGFDRYRGGFLGTTFYFIGQPTQEKDANFMYSYLRNSFNSSEVFSKKKKEGLWWVSTNESIADSNYLKLMVDLYSNLGLYFALDFSFKKPDLAYGGHFGIGFSRNLYLHTNGSYYPFPENLKNKKNIDWQDFFEINKSYLGGITLPFRWAFSYSQEEQYNNNLKIFIELDHYSDSYIYRDFLSQRSESSSFLKGFNLISGSSYLRKRPDQIGDVSLSSRMNFSSTPLINRFFQNFRLIYQNLNFSHQYLDEIFWEIKEAGFFWALGRRDSSLPDYDPMSSWFYLRKATFPSTSLKLKGALIDWKKDFSNEKSVEENKINNLDQSNLTLLDPQEDSNIIAPKPFPEEKDLTESKRSISLNLSYLYNPNLSLDSFWNGSLWKSPKEIQWMPSQVSFNWRDAANLEFIANFWEKFFIIKASPKMTSNWLSYLYQPASQKLNQYRTNSVILEQTFSLGSYFFQDIQWLKNSYILYNTSFNYLSYVQNINQDRVSDEYKDLFSKDSFKKNEIEVFNEASDLDKGISSSLIYRFPNNKSEFEHNLKGWLSFHPLKIDSLWGYTINSKAITKKIWGTNIAYLPISQITLKESIYYDVQNQNLESLNTLIRLGFFEFSFLSKQDYPYYFDKQSKNWQIGKDPNIAWDKNKREFLPYSLQMSFKGNVWENTNLIQKGRFYIYINTGYDTSIQRFTQSEFQFQWKLGFYLNDFTEISIFSLSQNTQFYRYFPFLMNKLGYPEETLSFWQDLWDSFSFWDSTALSKTNFKWSSFRLDFRQIFYDWYLTLSWTANPGLKRSGNRRILSWQNGFSFFVRWTPSTSIKSYLSKDKDSDIYQTGFGEKP